MNRIRWDIWDKLRSFFKVILTFKEQEKLSLLEVEYINNWLEQIEPNIENTKEIFQKAKQT